ncbi:putative extracellular cellulase CelA/allergen Asp F7-like [Aspergillus fijiensis CBS 313.89]|uniref:Expansin-like EG45 domain-containing protein n=1 Tax=Aspergillus fijiensis CBS 313.89 TaxID=1448319 RepID=A0A8G1VUJ0_9EURO|nr:uncharacterized protein BO72DRAFT_288278 [Aspergillus fijiensis CBS 313.89]RAK72198.1 hypothetical protein BO72DRAFT_288278 [Aspergillus fijiensis CBS 313.89]
MKYERLASLGFAALGALSSVTARPIATPDDDEWDCGDDDVAVSTHYATVTPTAAVETSTFTDVEATTVFLTTTITLGAGQTTSSVQTVVINTQAATTAAAQPTSTVEAVTVNTQAATTAAPAQVSVASVEEQKPSTTSTSTTAASVATTAAAQVSVASVEEKKATSSSTSTTAASAATSSASSSSSSSSSTSSSLSSEFSGEATFYGGNVDGGACSFSGYTIPSGLYGTALGSPRWDDAAQCGSCVQVTGPSGNKIKAMIVDECPECDSNHLDLFQTAFAELADISKGVISIDWEYVDCGITTPIKLNNKSGTSAYWFAMQVENSNEPVTALEVSTDGGSTWQSTTRSTYNYFENASGFGTDTVDVRVTGQSGATITVNNVSVSSGSSVTASSNFS